MNKNPVLKKLRKWIPFADFRKLYFSIAVSALFPAFFIASAVSLLSGPSEKTTLSEKEVQIALNEHNRVRKDVKLPPFQWDDEIAAYSQEWADELSRKGCRMEHRPRSGKFAQKYGENLFMGTAGYYTVKDAVTSWESEKKDYRGGPIKMDGNFSKIGHYTQIIWKSTTHVGCGKVVCRKTLIVVCNYNPPGNYVGRTPLEG